MKTKVINVSLIAVILASVCITILCTQQLMAFVPPAPPIMITDCCQHLNECCYQNCKRQAQSLGISITNPEIWIGRCTSDCVNNSQAFCDDWGPY